MAKAHITTKNGVSIVIEGTPKEVAELVASLQGVAPVKAAKKSASKKKTVSSSSSSRPTLSSLVAELMDGGFFKKPKELGAIKLALEEHGYHYPVTTLSPVLLRLVKKRQLRRIRQDNRWTYVG